jgi:hypothetical protein
MVLSQVRQFFPSFTWNDSLLLTPEFAQKIETTHTSVKDYLGYLLLDFALLDPSLEEIPFGWAFQFSEDISLKEAFNSIVKKEMKYSDKKLQQHRAKTLSAFAAVKEGDGEQIYEG